MRGMFRANQKRLRASCLGVQRDVPGMMVCDRCPVEAASVSDGRPAFHGEQTMHAALKAKLGAIASEAMKQPAGAARVNAFLNALGPIHKAWHSDPVSGRTYGFLLFHAEVIRLLKSVGGPAFFGGIPPYKVADFKAFGRPYNVTYPVPKGEVQALATFSTDLEDWHNRAHMAIEMATHTNMMDPLTNIHLREFWRLHYFIQAKFASRLRSFRQTPGQSTRSVITELETVDHAAVPTI